MPNSYAKIHGDVLLHTLGGFAPSPPDPPRRAWMPEDDTLLITLWPELRTRAIANRLNRSPEAVRMRARLLNLKGH